MIKIKPPIEDFSKHLFGDINRELLHLGKNDFYIIKQVLEYGKYQDWLLIKTITELKR
jgi:hypothetical protein